ncbi:MAG: glycosyltransferase [Flavobacterium sp.]|nr:glycosyltransferase [Flavobacterium sp.]
MDKKKIVHIVDSLCVGGRENVIIDLCNNFDKDKYSVFIITLCNDDNEGKLKLDKQVTLVSLPFALKRIDRGNTFLTFFSVKKKLTEIIRELKPDIIHTHSYFHRLLIIASAISSYSGKAKYFHTVHTSGMYFSSKGLLNRIKLTTEKFALNLYKPSLVGISEIVQENNLFFFKNYTQTSRYIPNGINLNKFNLANYKKSKQEFNLDEGDIHIIYVARLCLGKNHLTLFKAIDILVKKYSNVKLLLAGDGELRVELESYVRKKSLEKNIIFLGSIRNVPELLAVSDIGVFPSEFEGFSLTLIEMMAMELPIITSDNQIFKRLISHGKNGFLHSMFDENNLADLIEKLINDVNLRTEIGKNAQKYSEQFSIERMVLEHEDYYEN